MGIFTYLVSFAWSISSRITNFFPNSKIIGEWTLYTSPTAFNRTVTVHCPSIDFSDTEFLKLVKANKNYVKLNGKIIQAKFSNDEDMVFRRVCFPAEDGGMLSLDWPANLALGEQRWFKCTILIIPGTVEGSRERKIRGFASDCLRKIGFPIVMNPRGCAGSPLTTSRLFTAADSNDIYIAIQFITKERPGTTLMAVGWEYGANMLTKYLAECGDGTPIVAASCIDNPFDLEEATRSSVSYQDFNRRQTDGLIRILQHNKELFQGGEEPFDIDSALSALSVRDFEKAISMFSYGFDDIEDFYAKSSTRNVIDKLKVPVQFIQNVDARVPFFSIPRSMIMKNPYTSLLLCSYKPSSKFIDDRLTFSWCRCLILEWLKIVELVLRKDRHPLQQPPQPCLETKSSHPPLRVGTHVTSDTTNVDKENQNGMGNSYENAQPHGYTAETDVAIMGESNTEYDSSGTFDMRNRAGNISNQRKVERVHEEGQCHPEGENDFASDQDKKSEPCKTKENSKPQGYNGNEIDSHPRSRNSDNIIMDSCESQNQNEELKKDSASNNDGDDEGEQHLSLGQVDKSTKRLLIVGEGNQRQPRERQNNDNAISSSDEGIDVGNKVYVGAVTAALGASALIAHQHFRALLWGGMCGVMSVTDKLISFLRLAKRPLILSKYRILDFMVLLLWWPVLLPLLPTLMHLFGISEFACIASLYISIMIIITLWQKRIRKYYHPLLQHGFDLAKMKNFLNGLVVGAILVTLIHAINWSLGCGNLLWPTALSSLSFEHFALVKAYEHAIVIVEGIVTATGVATAEELLLRSRLPRETGADFGYPRGVFISGLVFALPQRSIWEIPGLWLMAMSLSRARQRSRENTALPIGLRAGVLAAGFILRTGGFLGYEATTSPLSGILAVNFILSCFINVCRSPLHILGTKQ